MLTVSMFLFPECTSLQNKLWEVMTFVSCVFLEHWKISTRCYYMHHGTTLSIRWDHEEQDQCCPWSIRQVLANEKPIYILKSIGIITRISPFPFVFSVCCKLCHLRSWIKERRLLMHTILPQMIMLRKMLPSWIPSWNSWRIFFKPEFC